MRHDIRCIPQHRRHRRLGDLDHFTVIVGAHCGGAVLAGEERHLAKAIPHAQLAHPNQIPILRNRDLGRTMKQDEHGSSLRSLLDDFFAATETDRARAANEKVELLSRQAIEERFAFQNDAGPVMLFVRLDGALAGHLEGANRERDGDLLPFEFVPDIGANRVVGLIDPGMIVHVKFDFVDDGEIGEIDQENLHRRFR